jgi:FkbM family methyltransferase
MSLSYFIKKHLPVSGIRLVNSDIGPLYVDTDDPVIGRSIYLSGEYEHESIYKVKAHVKPGHNCIDIGANIGYYSKLLSSIIGDSGVVYCFEPLPSVFSLLQKNMDGCYNAELYNMAVSDKTGVVPFTYNTDNYGNNSLSSENVFDSKKKSIHVSTVRLDDIIGDRKIDFIIIDVEGHELNALKGAENIIRRCRPIILMEYAIFYHKLDAYELLDFLRSCGYRLPLSNNEYVLMAMDANTNIKWGHLDMFLEPEAKYDRN